MTTPPTPAGWYPDPDGSGGQRYWDGSIWTQHRSPASEERTAIVELPQSFEQRVGLHRRPDDDAPEPSTPTTDNRRLITGYAAACAVLFAVLILALVYAFFIHDNDEVDLNASGVETSATETPTEATATAENGWGSPTETDSATPDSAPPPLEGAVADGPLSFVLNDVETGTTVSSTEAPVEKNAVGEFIVVRLTVVNTSDAPAQFVGSFQKLVAGGTPYTVNDEATFYVGGGFVEIPPGAEALVGLAYDVPPGTTPEFVELRADPLSPGVQLPLS